jgi:hypothetical protein
MRFFAFLSCVAFAAASAVASLEERTLQICLLDDEATKLANNFKSLILAYSKANAEAFLTKDFTDYSDSVNELINNGCPDGPAKLGTPTFTSLSAFEAGQSSQPSIPFQILNIWHGCRDVALRWRSSAPGFVQPEQPVTGIIVLEVIPNGIFSAQPWLIKTVYSEFNSGAWLYDLNITTSSFCKTK